MIFIWAWQLSNALMVAKFKIGKFISSSPVTFGWLLTFQYSQWRGTFKGGAGDEKLRREWERVIDEDMEEQNTSDDCLNGSLMWSLYMQLQATEPSLNMADNRSA